MQVLLSGNPAFSAQQQKTQALADNPRSETLLSRTLRFRECWARLLPIQLQYASAAMSCCNLFPAYKIKQSNSPYSGSQDIAIRQKTNYGNQDMTWIRDPPKNHRLSASAFRHLKYTLISCLSLSCVQEDRTQAVWNKLYPQVVWNKLLQSEISFQVNQVSTISCYNCDNSQASTLATSERPTTLDIIALTVSWLIQSTHERCGQSHCLPLLLSFSSLVPSQL